jgi:hypothetical protein
VWHGFVADLRNRGLASPLLDGLDLDGAVVTADALHTQRATSDYLHRRGAGFILPVKDNQPGLFDSLDALPWHHARSPAPPPAPALRPSPPWSAAGGLSSPCPGSATPSTVKTIPP